MVLAFSISSFLSFLIFTLFLTGLYEIYFWVILGIGIAASQLALKEVT